ncbi:MAG: ROK family protein [Erysipelotrichaceae bacterium]|nr:ROK family protein [Erysipelotrichaceae bacterium]
MKTYYVMDMGGTLVKYALMNENAEILEQGSFPAVTAFLDPFLQSLDENIRKYEGRYEGIAVSMPGRIDTARGIAHTGGAFRFFRDTPLGEILEEKYRVPVTLANDAKCAAQAEATSGALKDISNGAVIVIGTAIGGAIVLDHKVYMGSQNAAGEFSYLVTDFDLFTQYTTKMRGSWAGCFSSAVMVRKFAQRKNADPKEYNGIRFFEAYDQGDTDAIELLDEMGRMAAAGIFSLQAVLDLERIAIGGGISAREEVVDVIKKHLEKCYNAPSIPFCYPEIVRCRYGNDANLIGALSFHLNRE